MRTDKRYTIQITLPETPWKAVRFIAEPVRAGSYQEALDNATQPYGRNATGLVMGVAK